MKPLSINKIFKHRGINFKITEWRFNDPRETKVNFNYYLFFNEHNSIFTRDTAIKEVKRTCDEIGDFHGGVSYCHKVLDKTSDDPKERWQQDSYWFEVGCDYSHLWDSERSYDLDDILIDAIHSVECLIENGIYKNKEAAPQPEVPYVD